MKAAIAMAAFLVVAGGYGEAQTLNAGTNSFLSTTNSIAGQRSSSMLLREPSTRFQLIEPLDTNSADYFVSKSKLHLSGPVATTLKAKSPVDFSRRALRLVSPFSSGSQNLPQGADVSGPVKTRAWSTIVGWSPGRSAFPDEAHHEPPQLRLLSISVEKQP
jgi:hypothetical protein